MQKDLISQSSISGTCSNHIQAFLRWAQSRDIVLQKIIVAVDGQPATIAMYDQVAQAIVDAGLQVLFVGPCVHFVFLYSLHVSAVRAGIMITTSGQDGSSKVSFYLDAYPLTNQDLQEIYQLRLQQPSIVSATIGKIVSYPIMDQYLESLWAEFSYLSQYQFTFAIDASSNSMKLLLQKLIAKMNWKEVLIVSDQDINQQTSDDSLQDLQNMVGKNNGLFGVKFYQNGERITIIDEKNIIISPDRLIALFAQSILMRRPHAVIMHDLEDSVWLDYALQLYQGRVVTVKKSDQPLQRTMLAHDVVFAGNGIGKLYFKDKHYGYPDGLYSLLRLLDILVQERSTIHNLLVKLPKKIVGVDASLRRDHQRENENY